MKKGKLVLFSFVFGIFFISLINFASAYPVFNATLVGGATSVTVNVTANDFYNITINDTKTSSNLTEINFTAPLDLFNVSGGSVIAVNTSINYSLYTIVPSYTSTNGTLTFVNNTPEGIVGNNAVAYIWFNASTSKVGKFNVTITSLDNNSEKSLINITVTVVDHVPPIISFQGLPSSGSTVATTYLAFNVTAKDYSLKNITVYLYNSTGIIQVKNSKTSPLVVNFSGLNGTYYINATANDTYGNFAQSKSYTIYVNPSAACTQDWVCINSSSYGACNSTTKLQKCTNLYDMGQCNNDSEKPAYVTKSCTVNNTSASTTTNCSEGPTWNCSGIPWNPAVCGPGDTEQTKTCIDMTGCNKTGLVKTQPCNSGTSVSGKSSSSEGSKTGNSTSYGFFIIVGIIVISIIVVVVVLMKLKNKSYSLGDNVGNNMSPGRPGGMPPPRGPPRMPPNMNMGYQSRGMNGAGGRFPGRRPY